MTKKEALAKWASVYLEVVKNDCCPARAVEFGIADMINQTKRLSEADAAFVINDEADWMSEKLAKKAAA